MSTDLTEPGRRAVSDRHALLRRSASRLYRQRVKPALTRGLLAVSPQATLDEQGYVVDLAANLLPGLPLRAIESEFEAGAGGELKGKMRAPPPSGSTRSRAHKRSPSSIATNA